MFTTGEVKVTIVPDKPKSGMWHTGPNNCWIEVEHLPTRQKVRVYGDSMHKTRDKAVDLLSLLLEDTLDCKPLFPENLD